MDKIGDRVICKSCKNFYIKTARRQSYCSEKCRKAGQSTYNKKYYNECKDFINSNRRKEKRLKPCERCGILIEETRSDKIYCAKCRKEDKLKYLARYEKVKKEVNSKAIRRGKWSDTEKAYIARVMNDYIKKRITKVDIALKLGRTIESVRYQIDKQLGRKLKTKRDEYIPSTSTYNF